MRRLLRWAFNFASTVSALLFVATCVLWVRSYWRTDWVIRNEGEQSEYMVYAGAGTLVAQPGHFYPPTRQFLVFEPQPLFVVPFFIPAVVAAVLPVCWLLSVRLDRQRRRRSAGLCASCGYDLRATPEL